MGKAITSGTISDVEMVASKPDIVMALVQLWLRTANMGVAEKAREVLAGLLRAENPQNSVGEMQDLKTSYTEKERPIPKTATQGLGLMWRRVFNDKNIYNLFYSLCSMTTAHEPGQISKKAKSIAQGRLMDFLADCFDCTQIWTSQMPEVEKVYGVQDGLLEFALLHMVDYKNDVLMHATLIDFFTRFVTQSNGDILALNSQGSARLRPYSTKPLDFMISRNLHSRTMSYFLTPEEHDSVDVQFLYPSAAQYIAAYASHHPTHFIQVSQPVAERILERLSTILGGVTKSEWANDQAPRAELELLAQLPRKALLPHIMHASPLLHLPTQPANAKALYGLAKVFRGSLKPPNGEDLKQILPPAPNTSESLKVLDLTRDERIASRVLFYLYIDSYPNFWKDIIATAERVAIKETAQAAIALIDSIIDARWEVCPSESDETHTSPFQIPSESELRSRCRIYGNPLPEMGVMTVLLSPGIDSILPYLMQGPVNAGQVAAELHREKRKVLSNLLTKIDLIAKADSTNTKQWLDLATAVRRQIGETGSSRGGGSGGSANLVVGTMGR